MTLCDDVIKQNLALKFCDFHPQNRQIRRKFVAHKDLKLKKKAIRVVSDAFSITSDSQKLNFSTKKFPIFSLSKGMQTTRLNH